MVFGELRGVWRGSRLSIRPYLLEITQGLFPTLHFIYIPPNARLSRPRKTHSPCPLPFHPTKPHSPSPNPLTLISPSSYPPPRLSPPPTGRASQFVAQQ